MVAIFLFATVTVAQVTATSQASGTIITPISILNTVPMAFGNMAVSSIPGTVILSPASVRTTTGGVTLPSVTGSVSAASFLVSGAPNYTYDITIPAPGDITVVDDNNSHTMNVDTWTSFPSLTGTLDGSGNQIINIGATIHVSALQAAGIYISDVPFSVTVNYN